METVIKNILAIITAQDALAVAEQRAVDMVSTSKTKLVDLVIATVGNKPTYEQQQEFRGQFIEALISKGLTETASSQRYTRLMYAVKADERYEAPKATGKDAEAKRQSRGEFANVSDADLETQIADALASKDYSAVAKIGAEQKKREKMLERADAQKDKVYLKDLSKKVSELDMDTARLVAWVLVEKNLQQVKALIKSTVK